MAKLGEINKDSVATTSELAGIMGLSTRRIQQLVADGVLEQDEPGCFIVGDSVQRYIAFIKRNDRSEEEKKLDFEKKRAEVTTKKAKARREELATAELEGKMFRSEDVEAFITDLIFDIKASIISIPPRVSADVAEETDPAVCGDIIKKEVRFILQELARYEFDPEFYRERIQERKKMELEFLQETAEDE